MRTRYLLDVLVLALLIAAGSTLAPARSRFGANQSSLVWGSVTCGMPHSNGGRG